MNPEPREHQRYDETFKRSAVEHWLLNGKSVRQIAAELGVNVQTLHGWKQKFKELPTGQVGGTLEALQAENPASATRTAPRKSARGHHRLERGD